MDTYLLKAQNEWGEPALAITLFPVSGVEVGDELWEPCEEGPPVWFVVGGISSINYVYLAEGQPYEEVIVRPVRHLEEGTILNIRKKGSNG